MSLDEVERFLLWAACPHEGKRQRKWCGEVNFEKEDFAVLLEHVERANEQRRLEVFTLRTQNAALRNTITSMKKEKERG